MPTIKLDTNAYEILREVRDKLKEKGINATFSDAVRWLYEASENDKDSCIR